MFRRRRSPATDPHSRVVALLVREGAEESDAHELADALCGPAALLARSLLPGIETSDGPRWMTMAGFALPPTIGALAARVAPGHEGAATLPARMITAVGIGLGPGAAGSPAQGPTPRLRESARTAESFAETELHRYYAPGQAAEIRQRLAVVLGEAAPGRQDRPTGGWGLLTALAVLDETIPGFLEPRGEALPAARFGRALISGVALELIG